MSNDSDSDSDNEQNVTFNIAKPKEKVEAIKPSHIDRLFILEEPESIENFVFITLKNPKTGKNARYAVNSESVLYEVQRFKRVPSSFFINENTQEDGSLFITTPVDPLYLMLERLESVRKAKDGSEGVFVDLEEIFDDLNPHYKYLQNIKNINFELICDKKVVNNRDYLRLNDKKVINWLKKKVDRIGEYVEKEMPDSMNLVRAQSSNFRKNQNEKLNEVQLLQVSLGFISEYVSSKWNKLIREEYSLPNTASGVFFSTTMNTSNLTTDDGYKLAKHGNYAKREIDELETKVTPATKKRRVLAHEKIDTKNIPKISSFFSPIKKQTPSTTESKKES